MDHLPMEIILDVLSISEPDTIATFLRTASKFRDAAQPLLYDSIILKGPQALEGLLESLDAKPQFASRVRHLVARWNEHSEVGTPTYHVLTSLLGRTVNLESLVLRGFGGGIHLPSPLARLRDVECDCFPRSSLAIQFLSKIPNLRSIVLKEGVRRWTNIQPQTVSLDRIWSDVLKRVTIYSGPSSILAFLPKEAGLKHIQTTDFERISDTLDKLREATDGAIVSLECIPLPLHPPSIGFYVPSIQFLGTFQIMTIPPQSVWSDTERANYLQDARRTNAALIPILARLRQPQHVRFWAPHRQPAYPELYNDFVEGVKGCANNNLSELRSFAIWSPYAREARGRFMRYTRRSLASGEEGKSCEGWAEEDDPRRMPIREEVRIAFEFDQLHK